MNLKRFMVPALAMLLVAGGFGLASAYGAPLQGPPPGYGQGYGQDRGGWDAPPREYSDIERRGFRDGIKGAQKDFDNHRQPDVNNRDEYRHPDDVPGRLREEYREGFRRGYNLAVSHLMGGPGMGQPGMGQPMMRDRDRDRDRWDMAPREFSDIERRGFVDGLEGARKDFDNHRRPDVNNRDEYRHPHLPPEMRHAYREGFRRGYDRGAAHFYGGPGRY